MGNETRATGRQKMADDLWVIDFMRRAAPRLRDLMSSEEDKLPAGLSERLERLKRSEGNASKR
jgi:hypothetical protein